MTWSLDLKTKEEDQKSVKRKHIASSLSWTNEIHHMHLTHLITNPLRWLPVRMTLIGSLGTCYQVIRGVQAQRRLKALTWERMIIWSVTTRREGTVKSKVFELWEPNQRALNTAWIKTRGIIHIIWMRTGICTWESIVDDQTIEWGMWEIAFR